MKKMFSVIAHIVQTSKENNIKIEFADYDFSIGLVKLASVER